jgi:glycosyltransferase involved in cell wall biosynthesis
MPPNQTQNISFVIPAHNSESTLEATVDSIFKTNFADGDEVILVNDCSTDGTRALMDRLAEKYSPHVRIITNTENRGCPASRNVGMREVHNELIFSFDSDNILAENTVQKLKASLIANNADIATFGEVRFFVDGPVKITHSWIFKKGWFTLEDQFSGNFNPAPIGNYLFTKASWQKVSGFSELEKGLHEAWIFTFKQLLSGSRMYIDESGFYYHRYGHESLTIREYKKDSVEERILRAALQDSLHIFEDSEKEYILQNTPQWIHLLNKRPIRLASSRTGTNGRLHRTAYGICKSLLKKLSFRKS